MIEISIIASIILLLLIIILAMLMIYLSLGLWFNVLINIYMTKRLFSSLLDYKKGNYIYLFYLPIPPMMVWFGFQLTLETTSPLILWNEGFISYLLTALEAKFLTIKGLSYVVLTVINIVFTNHIIDNITVKREWGDKKFGDERVIHNILRSKYYDVYLNTKEEGRRPKWLRDDTCTIEFQPKIKSISTVDVFPLQIGIDLLVRSIRLSSLYPKNGNKTKISNGPHNIKEEKCFSKRSLWMTTH
jgi:hypothetical protein